MCVLNKTWLEIGTGRKLPESALHKMLHASRLRSIFMSKSLYSQGHKHRKLFCGDQRPPSITNKNTERLTFSPRLGPCRVQSLLEQFRSFLQPPTFPEHLLYHRLSGRPWGNAKMQKKSRSIHPSQAEAHSLADHMSSS